MNREDPNLQRRAVINPIDGIRDDEKHHGRGVPFPANCIVCFTGDVMRKAKGRYHFELLEKNWWGWMHQMATGSSKLGLVQFGIGDSFAALALELLIAKGVRNVIAIGTAGGIQRSLNIGDVILVTKAIRDEGVSYHYEAGSKYSNPSKRLNNRLENTLRSLGIPYRKGITWTTDAPYRETVAKVKQFQKEGVLSVEMEAAAFFSVAKFRRMNVSSLVWISDDLSELKWNPQFNTKEYDAGRDYTLEAAVRTFASA